MIEREIKKGIHRCSRNRLKKQDEKDNEKSKNNECVSRIYQT